MYHVHASYVLFSFDLTLLREPKMYYVCYFIYFIFVLNNAEAATQKQLDEIFFACTRGKKIFLNFNREIEHNDVEPYVDEYLKNSTRILSHIDNKKQTVIYIHGFTESINSSSVDSIVQAYITRGDHNIVAVDWSKIANENYLEVVASVDEVGAYIAHAISDMACADYSITRKIHIIGHSMGAHVAGALGRNMKPLLPRITGLDPAGPLFNLLRSPLTKADAEFVDIIHTDAGLYGKTRGTGTVDFWPNKGTRVQPGCPKTAAIYSNDDFCSHHRSWVFYAESVISEKAFLAVRCSSDTKPSRIEFKVIPMGFATPREARGNYCLKTSSQKPYGLKMKGASEQ